MIIYKITNIKNNKVYIGQTTGTLENRVKRHFYDANRNNTKFCRAIRKYGKDSFISEIIDYADTKEELDEKEIYWIKYYNSSVDGYNTTLGGEDAFTYRNKTKEEMDSIKKLISISKLGSKNPHSRAVKCKNMETNEEFFFDTVIECVRFFGVEETNHSFVTSRCNRKINCLYKKKWAIAYKEEDYPNFTKLKGNRRARKVQITNLETKEKLVFENLKDAEKHFSLWKGFFSDNYKNKKGKDFIFKEIYKVHYL